MVQAKMQMSQGATVAPNDSAYLQFAVGGGLITLTDTTLGAVGTRTWKVAGWPSPLAAAPVLSSPNAETTTFSPAGSDGMYLVSLIRKDSYGTSVRTLAAGVVNGDGNVLPCFGAASQHIAVGASLISRNRAIQAGYAGSQHANTNNQLDAVLRKAIGGGIGSYLGVPTVVTSNATPEVLYALPIAASGITVYEVTVMAYNATPRGRVWGPFLVSAGLDAGVVRFTSGVAPVPTSLADAPLAAAVMGVSGSGAVVNLTATGVAATNVTWVVRARKLV